MDATAIGFASCSPAAANGAVRWAVAARARQYPVRAELFDLETLGCSKLAGTRPPQTRAGHEAPHVWAFSCHPGKDRVNGSVTRLTNAVIVHRRAERLEMNGRPLQEPQQGGLHHGTPMRQPQLLADPHETLHQP